jgi:colanic acid/amylovoran biosynthesis glycosyltransferase
VQVTVRDLFLLSPVWAKRTPEGNWVLPLKFVDGVREYCRLWKGEVRVLMFDQLPGGAELDYQVFSPEQLPCEFVGGDVAHLSERLFREPSRSVMLLAPHPKFLPIAKGCLAAGIPLVLVTENSLHTQLQMLRAKERRPLKLLRSILWHMNQDRVWSRISRASAGVQCNGLPLYARQRKLNANTLLFFDNRTNLSECAQAEAVNARLEVARKRGFPRFMYSGKLISIKGVEDLVVTAIEVRRRLPDFELWIAGDGEQRALIEAQVRSAGLSERVRFLGVLDFHSELLPTLRRDVDIFICPHVQGDPSCTYLETMSAGVPIVGYANEALKGLTDTVECGQIVPMRDAKSLAGALVELWNQPERLRELSLSALKFARERCFEDEFRRRIVHLANLKP